MSDPLIAPRIAAGQQFNAYRQVRGGYAVGLGPVTDFLQMATTLDASFADYLVAALRAHAGQRPAAAPLCSPDEITAAALEGADLLDQYAAFIRTEKADDLERHPYIPSVEQAAQDLRRSVAKAGAA